MSINLPALGIFILVGGCVLSALPRQDAAAAEAVRPWAAEQDDAVRRARGGDPAGALVVLDRLYRAQPDDAALARDVVAVAVWAGRFDDAVTAFARMPPPHPDYVLEAAGLAYRRLLRPAEALAVYRQGLAQSPGNEDFIVGEIRSLADLTETAAAIERAEAQLSARGERPGILLAAGYAASLQRRPVEALRYIDRALRVDPASREARRDRILAIDEMGAPQVALRLADEEPGLLTPVERRRVEGDVAAALVRWGVLEPPSEAQRFAASDRAIALLDGLIARWSQQGEGARQDLLRARFDRMVALRDRVRMAEVLAEYEDLTRNGIALPGFAQVAAGDAFLYNRQPERARDLYLAGLAVDPANPETRLALFYAYVDIDDFDVTYRYVDKAAADEPIWLYLKGLNDPVENPDRAAADLAAANARLYGDDLADAHRRLAALAEAAPNNSRFVTALANLYAARGWPRRAAEQYEISRAQAPKNLSAEVGQGRNELDLQEYRAVETRLADLKQRFPENLEVRRLARLWQVQNMAEFEIETMHATRSATSVQGGNGLAIDARLTSPPIAYNWRAFASAYVAHESLSAAEGEVTLRRLAGGLDYRGRDLTASLEATLSSIGSELGPAWRDDLGRGRGGAKAEATWWLDDRWSLGGGAEIYARDTPLRALRNGITADAASASLAFRESESREARLAATGMEFSDGNARRGLSAALTERLYTRPHFTVDGLFGLAGSQNSADANRPYFNPSRDLLATAGVAINQTIHRRYEFVYEHRLTVTPGLYWQQGFGSGGAVTVHYEHRLRSDDVVEAAVGLSFSRQPYDGVYENSSALLGHLRVRF